MNEKEATTTANIEAAGTEVAPHEGQMALEMDFLNFVGDAMGGAIFTGHLDGERARVEIAGAIRAFTGVRPADEVEGMLAAQLVALHSAGMECLRRAAITGQPEHSRQHNLSSGTKLLRSFSLTLEALNKHRGKGQQVVRVEHVQVNAGGQAIIGNVSHGGSKEEK